MPNYLCFKRSLLIWWNQLPFFLSIQIETSHYYLSPLTISLDLLPLIKTKYLRTKQHNCFARQMRSFLEIPQFYIRGHYRHMQRASSFLKMKQGGRSNHFAMLTSLRERVRCGDVRCNWPPANRVPTRVVALPWHYSAYQDVKHPRPESKEILRGHIYSLSLVSMGDWFQDPPHLLNVSWG